MQTTVCEVAFGAESRESGSESLLEDFSISEICERECPETGCVCAETGSNPHLLTLRRGERIRGRKSRGKSLFEDFSISENLGARRPGLDRMTQIGLIERFAA
jgi:hypothetical protein